MRSLPTTLLAVGTTAAAVAARPTRPSAVATRATRTTAIATRPAGPAAVSGTATIATGRSTRPTMRTTVVPVVHPAAIAVALSAVLPAAVLLAAVVLAILAVSVLALIRPGLVLLLPKLPALRERHLGALLGVVLGPCAVDRIEPLGLDELVDLHAREARNDVLGRLERLRLAAVSEAGRTHPFASWWSWYAFMAA